jgi:spermidine/putrescine transport system ATP-binding protein
VITGVGERPNGRAVCFVRPEAVALAVSADALAPLGNRFSGHVSAVLFDGANSTLMIDCPELDPPVRATLPQAGPLAGIGVGDAVHFGWTAEAAKVFVA